MGVFLSWLNKSLLPHSFPWVWEGRPFSFEEREGKYVSFLDWPVNACLYYWVMYPGKNRLDNWGWQWSCERAPWDWGSILHSDFKISVSVVHLGTADVCIKYQSCFPHSYCLTPVNLFFFCMGGRLRAHAAGCHSFSSVPLWITLGPLEELQEVPKIGNLTKVYAFNETCIGLCAFLSLEDSINELFLFYGLCWLAG